MKFAPPLPIDAVLDEVRTTLAARAAAVLVAPPGAGKTTRVPLALMNESWLQGRKILVLEPRRIAARAAAARMAHSLSESVGERIGLRARMVSKSGPKTRIEVVTEGVFTRMILDDPEVSGIGAVLFDEFHERSLEGSPCWRRRLCSGPQAPQVRAPDDAAAPRCGVEGCRSFGPDLIIYHPKSLAPPHIAQKLERPCMLASPLPGFTPTSAFPRPLLPFASLGPLNRASHLLAAPPKLSVLPVSVMRRQGAHAPRARHRWQ